MGHDRRPVREKRAGFPSRIETRLFPAGEGAPSVKKTGFPPCAAGFCPVCRKRCAKTFAQVLREVQINNIPDSENAAGWVRRGKARRTSVQHIRTGRALPRRAHPAFRVFYFLGNSLL